MAENHEPQIDMAAGTRVPREKVSGRFMVPMLVAGAAMAVWRGWGLWYRGILEHDEGHALLNASTYRHAITWVLSGGPFSGSGSMAELRDALHREGGTLYSAGKSGYSLLLAAAGLPGGVSHGLALAFAWVAGMLVLAATGVLTYRWYGKRVAPALVAMAGVAFSPLVGALSREVSGTIWALALGMAGLAVLAWSVHALGVARRRGLQLLGGMLLGYGFTCHFNLAPFIGAAFLAHGWYLADASGAGRRQIFRHLLWPAGGVLLVLALFQIGTGLADRRLALVYPDYLSFAGELQRLIFSDQAGRIESRYITEGALGYGADAWLYLGRAFAREGFVFLLLIGVALERAFSQDKQGRRRAMPALILFLVPTFFWVAYPFKVERVLGMCFVPAWILAGGAVADLWQLLRENRRGRSTRRVAAAVAAAAVVFHVAQVTVTGWIPLWRQRSPIPQVVDATLSHMRQHGGLITAGSFNTGFAPVWKWTIVEAVRDIPDLGPGEVDFSRFGGATIVFIDPASWRRVTPEFPVSREEVEASEIILEVKSDNPEWRVSSHALQRR